MRKLIVIFMAVLAFGLFHETVYAQQSQGTIQGQGQEQGIAGDFGIQKSFNSKGSRFFMMPVDPYNAPMVPHFGGPNYKEMGPNYTSVTAILAISSTWAVDDLGLSSRRNWGDKTWDGMVSSCEAIHSIPRTDDRELFPKVKAGLKKPEGGLGLGICTVRATADNMTSLMVFKEMIRNAHGMGGNAIHVIAEGSTKEVEGWSIGLGGSAAGGTLSDDPKRGGTAAVGTGTNFGETHYESLPWIQAVVYRTAEASTQPADTKQGKLWESSARADVEEIKPEQSAIVAYSLSQR